MDDLTTYAENTWCPGCGNFGLFSAFKRAVKLLEERGIQRSSLFISAGIGCHGKIFDYLNLSGFYSIHGRSVATVQGVKLANPELIPVTFVGDGDAYGEGLEHLIFAAKRNSDVTVIVHNNGVYGLTTGQFTPVSRKGYRGPSTPEGSVEEPLNPIVLMLEAGATFVARGYVGRQKHLAEIFAEAMLHQGLSYVDVLQPCVTFNNTYKEYNEKVQEIEEVPGSLEEALKLAKSKEGIPIGIFYRVKKPVYHRLLFGEKRPILARGEKAEAVKELLGA